MGKARDGVKLVRGGAKLIAATARTLAGDTNDDEFLEDVNEARAAAGKEPIKDPRR